MTRFKKGNKTGNRFSPGQSGNPDGRPVSVATYLSKMYPEFEGMTMTKNEAAKVLIWLASLPMPNVRTFACSDEVPAFLAVAAKAIERSHEIGDISVLNSILDRLFGKPTQPLGNDEENPLYSGQGISLVIQSENVEPITSEAQLEAIMKKYEGGAGEQ